MISLTDNDIDAASLLMMAKMQQLLGKWSAIETDLARKPKRSLEDVRKAFALELKALIALLYDLGLESPSALLAGMNALVEVESGNPQALLMPKQSADALRLGKNHGSIIGQICRSYAVATFERLISEGVPKMEAQRRVAEAISRPGHTIRPNTVRGWHVSKLAKRANEIPQNVTGEEMLENLKSMSLSL